MSAGNRENSGREGPARRALERRVNAVLDAEAEGSIHEAAALRRASAGDPAFAQTLAQTRESVAALALMPESPDFTARVLDEVHARRGFRTGRARRLVSAHRVAVALGALAMLASGVLLQRFRPSPLPVRSDSAPVSDLVTGARADFGVSLESLAQAAAELRSGLVEPVDSLVWSRAGSGGVERLHLGDTGAYDVAVITALGEPSRVTFVSVSDAGRMTARSVADARPSPHAPIMVVDAPAGGRRSTEPSLALSALAQDQPPPGTAWDWDGTRWVPLPAEVHR